MEVNFGNFIPDSEIEEYNSVNSSEAFNESETGKEELKENNIDNSNLVNSENNLDNSNEVNTAVLSHSNQLNEESVISTEKIPENGLKQAKTRELEIINKTDNSNLKNLSTANAVTEEVEESKEVNNSINVNSNNNSVYSNLKNNNTANAVTEETVYSNIDNSKEVEGNNNRDNFNYVNSDNRTDNSNLKNNNTANAVTEKVEIINSVKPVIEEISVQNTLLLLKEKKLK